MRKFSFFFLVMAAIILSVPVFGSSTSPLSLDERIDSAKAIFRGTVLQMNSFRGADGGIYTRTILRVDEALKGKFPAAVQLVHRGGIVDEEGEWDGFAPRFNAGEERLVFLDERADGTLFAFDGGPSAILLHRNDGSFPASENFLLDTIRQRIPNPETVGIDASVQAAPAAGKVVGGLTTVTNGISARFTAPDRGEPIPYIVDTQAWPAGFTLNQAMGAVSNAFRAWSQVSSVQFVFAGTQNFGQASPNVAINDRQIRVQLHDLYNYITATNVLGIGGRVGSIPSAFTNGGMGGSVAGTNFFESSRGYLVLKHTNSTMQNLTNFEEVLCHEIGHVLSLDHSSENPIESDPVLNQAIMYYVIHGGGRGATLGTYDPPKVRLVHPYNTPPYGYSRVMDIVTATPTSPAWSASHIDLRGYDLQGTALSVILTNATANYGTFSVVGTVLNYATADGGDSPRVDPATTSYYDFVNARFSDGTNGSPFIQVRVMSYSHDTYPTTPTGSDGIPDWWMVQYFGNANPNVGTKHKATDDFDGDGISNLNEYLCGTDPTSTNSVLKFSSISKTNLQFATTRPYEVYELQGSTNLTTWSLATNPITPTSTTASFTFTNAFAAKQFFRVGRVP